MQSCLYRPMVRLETAEFDSRCNLEDRKAI